mmetsp:Transcript_37533/g.104362  ORF Transcript_37533/g.104362 Transcript_37533/m.104362 type:complete len:232 (+) Transcript_37533:107-802(+)
MQGDGSYHRLGVNKRRLSSRGSLQGMRLELALIKLPKPAGGVPRRLRACDSCCEGPLVAGSFRCWGLPTRMVELPAQGLHLLSVELRLEFAARHQVVEAPRTVGRPIAELSEQHRLWEVDHVHLAIVHELRMGAADDHPPPCEVKCEWQGGFANKTFQLQKVRRGASVLTVESGLQDHGDRLVDQGSIVTDLLTTLQELNLSWRCGADIGNAGTNVFHIQGASYVHRHGCT